MTVRADSTSGSSGTASPAERPTAPMAMAYCHRMTLSVARPR
jgi:hypothetical protein